ncbi:MAG: hydrogenase maturation protease [Candidatus Cloacimonetes bacterium]|nr:hydrogenase maturation protease [Candidatus Cloacimonadota bacterium]
MKNVILGIGNNIVTDDGIGLFVAQKLRKEDLNVEIIESFDSGFNLLDHIIDFDRAIFIDSIRTGKNEIGAVTLYNINDFKKTVPYSIHSTDICSAIDYSKNCGFNIPDDIFFIGIEIKDNFTFGDKFTEEINSQKETIYKNVKKKVCEILKN